MMKLFKHQKDALIWLKCKSKAILNLDAGLGKTITALSTITPDERVLIVVPNSLKVYWQKEAMKWTSNPVHKIKNRKEDFPKGKCIVIVNYDILGKKIGKKIEYSFDYSDFDKVILDEAHYIKNPKSIRSKIAAKIVNKTDKALLLTGTPAERSCDLFVPLTALGCIKMNYHVYGIRFCDAKKMYIGSREIWDYRGSSNIEELKLLMRPYVLTMKKEDVTDLPEKFFKVVELDLPLDRRNKGFNLIDIQKDSRAIGFEGLAELIHDEAFRMEALGIDHIKNRLENTDKIVIFFRHHDIGDMLAERLKSYNPVMHDGRKSELEKQKAENDFVENKDCRIFLGNIKSAGVGLNLQVSSNVIFFEYSWSWSDLSQCTDRCHRIGTKDNVLVEFLTIADSINTRMLYATLEKKQFVKGVEL